MVSVIKNIKFCFYAFLFIIIISCNDSEKKTIKKIKNLDSLTFFLKNSTNDSLLLKVKDSFTTLAYNTSSSINNDSLTTQLLFQLIKNSYKLNNEQNFSKYLPKAINKAKITSDTLILAKLYNYGGFFFNKSNLDSAYYYFYESNKSFKELNDSLAIGKTFLNLAIIQKNKRDYIGAELTSIKALDYLVPINNIRFTASIYNNLGIICSELNKYSRALNYQNKALILRKKLNNKLLEAESINNIAVTYKNSRNYKKAFNLLDSLYKTTISIALPNKTKARILDNLAHSKILANPKNKEALNELNTALSIRKKEKDLDGMAISYIHIGDYYNLHKNETKAIENYNKAIILAKKTKNFRDVLASLKNLSLISSNTNQLTQLNEFYFLTDSLEIEKNKVSDHFARIRFESDSKEAENLQLKNEKIAQTLQIEKEKTQKWLLSGGLGASLITLVVFGYYYQKNKKQQLLIESLQKELHHRVKNNLGIIDTFIEVAKEEFSDKPFENKLTELQNRIASIHKIHEQLHINKDVTQLNLSNYITTLSATIKNSFSNNNISIIQKIDSNLQMDASKSFPIGLIINEFLTNSFKYAFDKNTKGTIEITITEDKKNYYISLKDNGKGLPPNFNIDEITTFGFRIIKLLSNQLNGIFNLKNKNGVLLTIQFPK